MVLGFMLKRGVYYIYTATVFVSPIFSLIFSSFLLELVEI